MKWNIVSLLVLLAVTYSKAADPVINCYFYVDQGYYRVRIAVLHAGDPPFDGFTSCVGNHVPGYNNSLVQIVTFEGGTPHVPSVVCKLFPNTIRLYADEAGLLQTRHFPDCQNLLELSLGQNLISSLENNAFSNNQKLVSLNLESNQIVTTNDYSLYENNNMEVIDLRNNPNIVLTPRFFQFVHNLRTLNLQSCGLRTVNPTWFANTTLLTTLNLAGNHLNGTLTSSTFWSLGNLETLNLGNCEIDALPGSIFYYNRYLSYLNLTSNDLKTLSSNLLRNQTVLETLVLSNNPFDSLPDDVFLTLGNLRSLYLNNCSIKSLKLSWFSSLIYLKTLNLESNEIEEIPYGTFGVENFLENLYFSNNKLRILDATSFARLNFLKDLRVRQNQIFAIDGHFLEQPEKLFNAWFSYNDCINEDVENFYQNHETNIEKFRGCFDNFDRLPVDFVTVPNETFRWFSLRWETLVVHIKAEQSAKLILSNIKSDNSTSTLEIQFGMLYNNYLYIKESGDVKKSLNDRSLRASEWVSFVVTWKDNVLSLYKKGDQLPFIQHIINNPFKVSFFGVSSELVGATWHINKVEGNFLQSDFPLPPQPTTTTTATTNPTTTTYGTTTTI